MKTRKPAATKRRKKPRQVAVTVFCQNEQQKQQVIEMIERVGRELGKPLEFKIDDPTA